MSDDIDRFVRRRRWFHVQAIALGSAIVLLGVAFALAQQRVAAAAGVALVLAAVAAIRCRRTLVSLGPPWHAGERDDAWMDGRPLTWEEMLSVAFVLAAGVGLAILGAIGRLDLLGAVR
jgi:hypothetical protein